jgi:peroxiredoxin Q/BCP
LDKTGGAIRGVFVVDKEGKVVASQPGGPAATVEVVKKLVGGGAVAPATAEDKKETNGVNGATKEDIAQAETAAQVADTAEKLDSNDKPAVA